MTAWTIITSLGDVPTMAAAAAAIGGVLVVQRAWRVAFWWCLLLAIGSILVVTTKIAFMGWGIGICPLDFKGVSGHSMRATAVIPVMCYLVLQRAPALTRMSGVLLGMAVGAMVAISRLVLHFHSVSEAVAGGVLGLVVSLSIIKMLRTAPAPGYSHPFLASALLPLSLLFLVVPQAEPSPTQRWMVELALYLSDQREPFVEWKSPALDPGCRYRTHDAGYAQNLFANFDVHQAFSSGRD